MRNQDGACPWCEVSDVLFEHNVVRHSSGAVNILGVDDNHPSRQTRSIVIRSNVFSDIDNQRWGGSGYAFQMSDGPRDITIDRNTIIHTTSGKKQRLRMRDSLTSGRLAQQVLAASYAAPFWSSPTVASVPRWSG